MTVCKVGSVRSEAVTALATVGRTTALLALTASVALTPTMITAQTTTPYGSPLDPYSQQQQNNTTTNSSQTSSDSSTSNTNETNRIQAVEVNGTNSDTGNNSDQESTDDSTTNRNSRNRTRSTMANETQVKRPALPSEYEKLVQRKLGKKLPRFGADLLIPSTRDFATPAVAMVPSSYVLNPGDEIFIGLSGSLDGTVETKIDNNGQIFLPKVGPVKLAGVTYGDLRRVLMRAIGTQFRDFRLSVSMTRLRGIRVYVTGFANNPGAYSVSSLSTMVNAVLAAGGPASGGSFRAIKLYRNGQLVSDFDLYDLIRRGDKSRDAILQNEDVLYIPPVGPQVAFTGSVNQEAIYEARPEESLSTLLSYAGGAALLADKSRVILYRIESRDVGGIEVRSDQLATTRVMAGDVVQVLSAGSLIQPLERQSVTVRVEGEVYKPGNYYVSPNTTLDQVMQLAGGLTSRAFVYGTNFQRVSVKQQQQESFKEAIQQFEISLAAAPILKDSAIDATTGAAQMVSARAVLDRLKQSEPDGRVVLDIDPSAAALPGSLTLEDNDTLYIPARPTTVGVFGAVYRPASFFLGNGKPKTVAAYLDMAGGAMRAGDKGQIFVVRANGAVISKQRGALSARALPGDVIFVPVKTQSTSIWAKIQQISTIVFQFGLSAAAFYAVTK